jgi:hypothetical protein
MMVSFCGLKKKNVVYDELFHPTVVEQAFKREMESRYSGRKDHRYN